MTPIETEMCGGSGVPAIMKVAGESRESVMFWGLSREGVESRSVVRCELRTLTNLKLWPEPLFFYTLTDSIL